MKEGRTKKKGTAVCTSSDMEVFPVAVVVIHVDFWYGQGVVPLAWYWSPEDSNGAARTTSGDNVLAELDSPSQCAHVVATPEECFSSVCASIADC